MIDMTENKNLHKNSKMQKDRLSGIIINKKYIIQSKIASGGMADVYAGQDVELQRKVAVKIMHESYAGSRSFTARFQKEAQILSNLKSPNIISIFDYGEFEGLYYIIMEFVNGMSLKELIDKNGALDPETSALYAIQICTALELAHKNNLIHRDIKPQNILIDENGILKVTDFGIAKFTSADITKTKNILGTAHYLSPEQAQGKSLDNRTDIYSLGILMYEMLVSDVPFRGGSSIDISIRQISEKPQPLSGIISNIPAGLEYAVMKCLEKNPGDRYQDITSLKKDLENFIYKRPFSFENNYKHVSQKNKIREFSHKPYTYEQGNTGISGQDHTLFMQRYRKVLPGAMFSRIIFFILFLIFLSLFIVSDAKIRSITGKPEMFIVPQLKNTEFFSAEKILSGIGLKLVKNSEQFSEEFARNYIIGQFPKEGAEVEKNTVINVSVSNGPETIIVIVPNIISLSIGDAEKALSEAGLAAGDITEQYSDYYKNQAVIEQSPAPFSETAKNTFVNIILSKGKELITVPDLKGYNYYYARSNLEALGLEVIVKRIPDISLPSGTVAGIEPREGSSVYKNTVISLFISTNEQLVLVPYLKNLDLNQAVQILDTQGLNYEIIYIEVDYSVQENTIISQFPEPSEFITLNEKIILFVGRQAQ